MNGVPTSNVVEPPSGPKHISALDGIRGFAVLLVVLIHLQQAGVVPANFHLVNVLMHCGWCGVDLFFVLSGFLITLGLLDSKGSINYFSAFYMRRILRIFPLYYAVLTSVIICSMFVVRFPLPSWPGWIPQHLLFVENWWMPFETSKPNILGHFWSLGIEEQFYLVWPLCVWLLPLRRLAVLCVAICAAVLILRFVLIQYYSPLPHVMLMNTVTRLDTLIVGALCAVIVRDQKLLAHVRRWLPIVVLVAASGLGAVVFLVREISAKGHFIQTLGFTALAVIFGPLVMWAYLFRGYRNLYDRLFSIWALRKLGKYSYGIYVYHYPVIVISQMYLGASPWFGHDILRSLLFSFGAVTAAICLAVVSYEIFEKRFLLLKRYFKPTYELLSEHEVSSSTAISLPRLTKPASVDTVAESSGSS